MHRRSVSILLTSTAVVLALVTPTAAAAGAERWRAEGRAAVARARRLVGAQPRARNVILFVGDGMGITTVTAARIRDGQLRGASGEENVLAFETLPFTALSKTYSTDFQVSDSAATITALLAGVKTRSGVIGLDETVPRDDVAGAAAAEVPSLFEQAEARGLWTGIVTTTRVTHATPAGAYAHTPNRDWESDADLPEAARGAGMRDIARQMTEFRHGDGLEVVLGGGLLAFLPAPAADTAATAPRGARRDGRDLVAEWRAAHPAGTYVATRDALLAVDRRRPARLLGLFNDSHMQFEADRGGDEPSLAEMTGVALDLLAGAPQGFVLLVEGGRVDHAHHAGNAARALGETIELARAVRVALDHAAAAETLIVVTADHSHTLSMSGYPKRGNPILGVVRGSSGEGPVSDAPATDQSGRAYATLSYANGPGYPGASDQQPEGPKRFPHLPTRADGVTKGRPVLSDAITQSPDYLQEATVPLAAETHGGEDVPIYAGGPGAALFHGVREQTYVYHAIVAALGWPD